MKSILFRGIGVSLFLICLTFSAFADGEMGTGSKTGGGGFAPDTTTRIETETDNSTAIKQTEDDFLGWLAAIFADVLS